MSSRRHSLLHGERKQQALEHLRQQGMRVEVVAYFPHEEGFDNPDDTRTMKATLHEVAQTHALERFVLPGDEIERLNRKGFWPHLADAREILFHIVATNHLRLVDPETKAVTTKLSMESGAWFGITDPKQKSWQMRLRAEMDPERPQGDALLVDVAICNV